MGIALHQSTFSASATGCGQGGDVRFEGQRVGKGSFITAVNWASHSQLYAYLSIPCLR